MVKPRPSVVARLEERLLQFMRERDHAFPEFLSAARRRLPHRSEEPRFEFVVYRLWREARWLEDAEGRPSIREFEAFEDSFEWESEILPDWMNQALVERTLSVWQPRYERKLSVNCAIQILSGLDEVCEASP